MARRAVKAHFQPNPPEFSKVVNVTNMTKNWHWLLDGKLQNVNAEDLHDQAKELQRPEGCGRATYSRPQSLAAAGPAQGHLPVAKGPRIRRLPPPPMASTRRRRRRRRQPVANPRRRRQPAVTPRRRLQPAVTLLRQRLCLEGRMMNLENLCFICFKWIWYPRATCSLSELNDRSRKADTRPLVVSCSHQLQCLQGSTETGCQCWSRTWES